MTTNKTELRSKLRWFGKAGMLRKLSKAAFSGSILPVDAEYTETVHTQRRATNFVHAMSNEEFHSLLWNNVFSRH